MDIIEEIFAEMAELGDAADSKSADGYFNKPHNYRQIIIRLNRQAFASFWTLLDILFITIHFVMCTHILTTFPERATTEII